MRAKHWILWMLTLLFSLVLWTGSVSAAVPVQVTVDGTAVAWTDAVPFIAGGRTMVPLRAAAEAMGLTVDWDAATKTAIFHSDAPAAAAPTLPGSIPVEAARTELAAREVSMTAGSPQVWVWDQIIGYDSAGKELGTWETEWMLEMDTALVLRGGRSYAPIRYVAEQFGKDVLWDAQTNTVSIVPQQMVEYTLCAVSYGSPQDDRLAIGLTRTQNVQSASLTELVITDLTTGDAASADHLAVQAEDTTVLRRRFTGTVQVLGGIDYAFAAGHDYRIRVGVMCSKPNGAVQTVYTELEFDSFTDTAD